MKNLFPLTHPVSDRIGMVLSTLCLIHCLFLPALFLLLPLVALQSLPAWMSDMEWVHAALFVPVLLISGPALAHGGIRDYRIWVLAVLAIAALGGALLIESERIEQLVTVTGAILLMIAHVRNMNLKAKR